MEESGDRNERTRPSVASVANMMPDNRQENVYTLIFGHDAKKPKPSTKITELMRMFLHYQK
jgi:hypothetical protein